MSTEQPVVQVRRRTIDVVLIALGAILAVVLFVAGGLLTWGKSFAEDYVHDELSSQNIFFSDADTLTEEGHDDLVKWAGEQVTTGRQAEGYAAVINGHMAHPSDAVLAIITDMPAETRESMGLQPVADGGRLTYSQTTPIIRYVQGQLTEAQEGDATEAEISDLEAQLAAANAQQNTLFRGETLRGLLLSSYAWSTIGEIAGIAAIVAFVAGAVMVLLVIAGVIHLMKSDKGAPAPKPATTA